MREGSGVISPFFILIAEERSPVKEFLGALRSRAGAGLLKRAKTTKSAVPTTTQNALFHEFFPSFRYGSRDALNALRA
jgi:hypothetical protein